MDAACETVEGSTGPDNILSGHPVSQELTATDHTHCGEMIVHTLPDKLVTSVLPSAPWHTQEHLMTKKLISANTDTN